MNKLTNKLLSVLILLLIVNYSWAAIFTAASFGYGSGFRDDIKGGRVSLVRDWQRTWFADWSVNLTGSWDFSVGYWHNSGDAEGKHKDVATFAIAPVIRLQFNRKYIKLFDPYFQLSIGGAIVTDSKMGNSDLGGILLFQDLVGAGIKFGPQQRFDLSLNFLHYSNAGFKKPNNGITLKRFATITYHFV